MRHDGDEWQEVNGGLCDLSNDHSHLKVTCLVFPLGHIRVQGIKCNICMMSFILITFSHLHLLALHCFSPLTVPFQADSLVGNSIIPNRLEEQSRDICFHFNLTWSWYPTNYALSCTQIELDILYLMGEIFSTLIPLLPCEESHDTLQFPSEWTGRRKVRVWAN